MRQRNITPEQILQKLSTFDFKTNAPEKKSELCSDLVDYVVEVSGESTPDSSQEILPEKILNYLILDLFFTFSGNSVFFQRKEKLSEKLSDFFKLPSLDSSKDGAKILKRYELVGFFIEALSKCENIFYFFHNNPNIVKSKVDFSVFLGETFVKIFNNPKEKKHIRIRAASILIVIHNILESHAVSFIGDIFNVLDTEYLQLTPTELIQSFYALNVDDEISVQYFVDQAIFFYFFVLKVLGDAFGHGREKGFEVAFSCIFLLFYDLPVDKDYHKKFSSIEKYLVKSKSNIFMALLLLYAKVMFRVSQVIPQEKESIECMKLELKKSVLANVNLLVLNNNVFERGFLNIFLTSKLLKKYVEDKRSYFPKEFSQSVLAIQTLISDIKLKCIDILNSLNIQGVGLAHRNFAIRFLLIPAVFETLPEYQIFLIIELKGYLLEKIPDLEVTIYFDFLKADWLDYADKLVGFKNEIDQLCELFSLFLQEYPFNKVNFLDERLQRALSSLQVVIDQLNKILEATKQAKNFWCALERLYGEHIDPLILYLQGIILKIPEGNKNLGISCQAVLSQLQNKKEFIKLHYQSFVSLKEGDISPRQFINEIVTVSHSISITALVEKLNSLISAPQSSFSWFGSKKPTQPIKPIQDFSKFLSGYQQHSQKELKSNSLLSIDFSIFKCTYVPPVTQGVRERSVGHGERMRVLKPSKAPVDWNALYPLDQPVPNYSQLIDMSVFSNTYTPSLSFSVDEKEKEYVLK